MSMEEKGVYLWELLVAWQAGVVSEGRMVELTGIDRIRLRHLMYQACHRTAIFAMVKSSEYEQLSAPVSTKDRQLSMEMHFGHPVSGFGSASKGSERESDGTKLCSELARPQGGPGHD